MLQIMCLQVCLVYCCCFESAILCMCHFVIKITFLQGLFNFRAFSINENILFTRGESYFLVCVEF